MQDHVGQSRQSAPLASRAKKGLCSWKSDHKPTRDIYIRGCTVCHVPPSTRCFRGQRSRSCWWSVWTLDGRKVTRRGRISHKQTITMQQKIHHYERVFMPMHMLGLAQCASTRNGCAMSGMGSSHNCERFGCISNLISGQAKRNDLCLSGTQNKAQVQNSPI